MTLREKLLGAGALIFLIAAIWIGRTWLEEHEARVKAESIQAAQQQVFDQAQKVIDTSKSDQAKIASDLQARLAVIETERRQPVSAAEIAAEINAILPRNSPPAIVVQQPAAVPLAGNKQDTNTNKPDPPVETVQIPSADLEDLQAYKLNCDANGAKLQACELTAADQVAELNAAKTQITAVTKERDAYKAAEKGGSFFSRLKKDAKCLGATVGASAIGAYADKNQPARGAAIGVVVGGVGCKIF